MANANAADRAPMIACTRTGGRSALPNRDRKSTRLNSSHSQISYAVFCLKKKRHRLRLAKEASQLQPQSYTASRRIGAGRREGGLRDERTNHIALTRLVDHALAADDRTEAGP